MIKNSLGIKETSLQQVNDYAKGKDITMATLNEVYLYMTIGYKD
jgi:DNA-binding Xre family transcriptional regulator